MVGIAFIGPICSIIVKYLYCSVKLANVPNVKLDLPKHHLRTCLYPVLQCSLYQLMLDICQKTIMNISAFFLIGDIFSKFVQVIPLKDHIAPVLVDALLTYWVFIHGKPLYLLSDQGSNVDGQVMCSVCNELGIKKRQSSA